jgi:Cysteine rich repeat
MNRTTIPALAFAAAVLAFMACTSATMAQRGVPKACASDVNAHCAGVQPGAGRLRACFKEHLKDLSQPCRAELGRRQAGRRPD